MAGAQAAYQSAAQQQTAYYGLLASEKLGLTLDPALVAVWAPAATAIRPHPSPIFWCCRPRGWRLRRATAALPSAFSASGRNAGPRGS